MSYILDSPPEPFYNITHRAGQFVYLSGFGLVYHDLNVVGSRIEDQTAYTVAAMVAALASEGATWDDVVRVNVFLRDLADRDRFNATYLRCFREHMPTRRLIGAGDKDWLKSIVLRTSETRIDRCLTVTFSVGADCSWCH